MPRAAVAALVQRIFMAGSLHGTLGVPGDKSISHRALMLLASSSARHVVRNLNPGRDVLATRQALQSLGVSIEVEGEQAAVRGGTLREATHTIDCMNSGSTARMLMGICSGANIAMRCDGDPSLRRRPMEPVAAQLRAFGARIETTGGMLPASVQGTAFPQTRRFILLSPSAQVKSAILLAAVFARTPVTILADKGSRDHTERMLRYFGADIEFDQATIALRAMPHAFRDVDVPGDFSAAAFFIVAATVSPGSSILITGAGVNPTRTGLLDALEQMGARIRIERPREICGEPVADIAVESAQLRGTPITAEVALRAIDEIPLLAIAAGFAQGRTHIAGVGDLRTKESDRIAAIERLLQTAGITVETLPNAVVVAGGKPACNGAVFQAYGDHRLAMAAGVLAAGAGPLTVDDESCIEVSFPSFNRILQRAQHA